MSDPLLGIAHSHLSRPSPALVADPSPVLGLPHSAGQLSRLPPQTLIHWLLKHSHQENEHYIPYIYHTTDKLPNPEDSCYVMSN